MIFDQFLTIKIPYIYIWAKIAQFTLTLKLDGTKPVLTSALNSAK